VLLSEEEKDWTDGNRRSTHHHEKSELTWVEEKASA
jgi:hypothetical protein